MKAIIFPVMNFVISLFRSRFSMKMEIPALCHQVQVLVFPNDLSLLHTSARPNNSCVARITILFLQEIAPPNSLLLTHQDSFSYITY